MTARAVSLQASVRIDNQTAVPTKTLEACIDFVQAMLPSSTVARFCFRAPDGDRIYAGISGLATYAPKNPHPVFPGLVEIWMPDPTTGMYPYFDQYVPDLPAILIRSWEEELLLVLAHELRHIHQFYGNDESLEDLSDEALEVDAEKFACRALKLWRNRRPNGRCRTVLKRAA